MNTHALVLLSGGFDSTVALHWALETYSSVSAVSVWYGQPNAVQEVNAARIVAARNNVPCAAVNVGEAVRGLTAIGVPPPGSKEGVSRANLPARNVVLLSIAVAHAARERPGRSTAIVLGVNLDDAAGFPDCRAPFLEAAEETMRLAVAGIADVRVRAPWVEKSFGKTQILGWAKTRSFAWRDVRSTVSCYAGTRCGACDPCILRARAFAAHGIEDEVETVREFGGDPQRERR